VEGASGYEVVWRETTAAHWENALGVGPETTELESRRGTRERVRCTVAGVSADGHFFGVRSVSEEGHRSRAATPARP
jgi:cysteine synthase